MKLSQLLSDEDAVSPVIGVILMVAITVILAAVIGTFVLGLGDQVSSSAPQASFTFDFNDTATGGNDGDNLTVTHDGGDSIKANKLNASVSGATTTANGGNCGSFGVTVSGAGTGSGYGDLFDTSGDVNAGQQDTVASGDFCDNGGSTAPGAVAHLNSATVRVFWTAESGDTTQTLAKWEGPDA